MEEGDGVLGEIIVLLAIVRVVNLPLLFMESFLGEHLDGVVFADFLPEEPLNWSLLGIGSGVGVVGRGRVLLSPRASPRLIIFLGLLLSPGVR